MRRGKEEGEGEKRDLPLRHEEALNTSASIRDKAGHEERVEERRWRE